jgi:hypothetical protein
MTASKRFISRRSLLTGTGGVDYGAKEKQQA